MQLLGLLLHLVVVFCFGFWCAPRFLYSCFCCGVWCVPRSLYSLLCFCMCCASRSSVGRVFWFDCPNSVLRLLGSALGASSAVLGTICWFGPISRRVWGGELSSSYQFWFVLRLVGVCRGLCAIRLCCLRFLHCHCIFLLYSRLVGNGCEGFDTLPTFGDVLCCSDVCMGQTSSLCVVPGLVCCVVHPATLLCGSIAVVVSWRLAEVVSSWLPGASLRLRDTLFVGRLGEGRRHEVFVVACHGLHSHLGSCWCGWSVYLWCR